MVSDTSRNHLFLTSKSGNSVAVWDEVAGNILTTIPVGNRPWGVTIANNRVFVGNNNSATVSVIDAATLTKIGDINLNNSKADIQCIGGPTIAVSNPNTNRVYVGLYGAGRVAVIDATTNTLIDCLSANAGTFGVAINPNLNQLYVTNRDGMDLQVFDISTVPGRLVQDVKLGGVPFMVQANPSTNKVYVMVAFDAGSYSLANRLQAYSATAGGVTLLNSSTIGNTDDGGTIWVSQASGALYIAATSDGEAEIVDPTTLAMIGRIPMIDPFGITENFGLGRIYVGNRAANTFTILPDTYGPGAPP